jgi:subtilisin family serine protease
MKPAFKKILALATILVFARDAFLNASVSAGEVLQIKNPKQRKLKPGIDYREGELIIKYKSQTASISSSRAKTLSRIQATQLRALNSSESIVHAKLSANQTVAQAIADLAGDENIEYVQPNYVYHITTTTPNDTYFSSLWGLKNTGQTISALSAANQADSTSNPPSGSTSGKDMDLTSAWDTITDCSSVVVAVIDTGIKYDHADLSSNMWNSGSGSIPNHGWNVITGASTPNNPMDDHGHGTHVAGTIGAVGNNGVGTTGICWKVQLMAVKALDSDGAGTTSDIVTGINWAVSHGAKVINMSLGGGGMDSAMSTAIDNAKNSGTVVVVAAGNEGSNNDSTPSYPCSFSKANLICVAALDQAYGLATFSNYGANSVDVAAPGVNIASTWPYSVTAISEDFSSGWTYSPNSGGWGLETLSLGGVPYPSLVNPSNWNGTNTYSANSDHHVYKTFNLSGVVKASLAYLVTLDTESGTDLFSIYNSGTGGDPITGGSQLSASVDSGNQAYYNSELPVSSSCLTTTCTIGLRFYSNASVQKTGVAFLQFQVMKSVYDTTHYNVLEGTSMATPHVAGLAAMIFAYNPSYTYADVVAAIKNGVALSALSGKTKTGKAVNAMNALSYIQAPTSVTAVAQ